MIDEKIFMSIRIQDDSYALLKRKLGPPAPNQMSIVNYLRRLLICCFNTIWVEGEDITCDSEAHREAGPEY